MTTTENAPRVPAALNGVAEAVARHGEVGRRWLEGMWRGDPLADAVVDNGAAMVRRAIVGGIESLQNPPAALVDLFAQLDSRPDWFDEDRCDRAAGHLARHSREYGFVLGAASLLAGAQNSIAGKPLVFTGRYTGDAAIRSIEVGSWLTAATTPRGMLRDADGFEQTVRVRMIHAHIRVQLARERDWDMAGWGLPIPQSYMSFTLAEFCSVALRAMRQLGVRYRDAELDDIHHLWRYVGHVVGVDDDYLPVTPNDYARIEDLYALTAVSPDEHDRKFVAALTDFQAAELARFVGARWARPIIYGLQRAFVGDAVAGDLSIPRTRWTHLPRLLAPLIAVSYAAHDRLVPRGKAKRTARGLQYRSDELARLRAHYAVTHELVDDVARRRS